MLEAGQIIPIKFRDREFRAIIIAPDGLGYNRPTIGLGYRSMSRHTDVPLTTLVKRVIELTDEEEGSETSGKFLKLPSGKLFKVTEILGNDNNTYQVRRGSSQGNTFVLALWLINTVKHGFRGFGVL